MAQTWSDGTRSERVALAWLCTSGLAMLAFVGVGPSIIRNFGYGVFIPALAASGLLTLIAAWLARAVPVRTGLIIILGLALAMRLLLVGEAPFLSTDIYRYIWDGRVQASGINPYLYVPADPALAALRDAAIYPFINRADYAVTAYPPVAEMAFLAVTRIAESLTAMRLSIVACEILICAGHHRSRAAAGAPGHRGRCLCVAPAGDLGDRQQRPCRGADGRAADARRLAAGASRAALGAVAVALAVLVKPYAVLALPAFWRPWDWRAPLAAIATVILCYLPYAGAGRGVLGFVDRVRVRGRASRTAPASGSLRSRRRCRRPSLSSYRSISRSRRA